MKRIEWYKNLYVSPSAGKQKKKIMWKVTHKAGLLDTYLIILPHNGNNQLEILNSSQLLQRHYNDLTTYVVGIAVGYEEALSLIELMVNDIMIEKQEKNMRNYFERELKC